MTAKVITVAQQKGGAGKTTLLAQLAVAWAVEGRKVAVVDIDPQGSLAAWLEVRRNGAGDGSIDGGAISAWRLGSTLRSLARDHDLILIDSPPHAATEAKVAIRGADLVLVPCQPSRLDLWATRPTVELAESEGRPFRIVLSRVPARGRLGDDARRAMAQDGLPLLDASLGNRVAFAHSMGDGRGVCEVVPRGPAALEVRAVAAAVEQALA
jgi:chromosome partitioning protein